MLFDTSAFVDKLWWELCIVEFEARLFFEELLSSLAGLPLGEAFGLLFDRLVPRRLCWGLSSRPRWLGRGLSREAFDVLESETLDAFDGRLVRSGGDAGPGNDDEIADGFAGSEARDARGDGRTA